MDHPLLVHVLQGTQNLLNYAYRILFERVELLCENGARRVLGDQKDMEIIGEGSVRFDDVGVIHSLASLQLNHQLAIHVVFLNSGLKYFLECKQSPCFLMPTS
jgi:hypothetical protein